MTKFESRLRKGLASMYAVNAILFTSLGARKSSMSSDEFRQTLPSGENILNQNPFIFSALFAATGLVLAHPLIQEFRYKDEVLLYGLGEMQRPDGPSPTPRVDSDVLTGLPNHRATPERRAEIMVNLAAKHEEQAGKANNAS
jgi:hypothetical protein